MDRSTIAERVRSKIAIGHDMSRLTLEPSSRQAGLRTEGDRALQTAAEVLDAIAIAAEMIRGVGIPHHVGPTTAAGRLWGQVDLIDDEMAHAIGSSGVAQGVGIHHHVAPMAAAGRL